MLASDVLGSTITLGAAVLGPDQGPATAAPEETAQPDATATAGTGQGTDQATATPGTGTDQATATPGTDAGTGTDQDITSVTVEDMIVDIDTGDILYVVITTSFDAVERWIPVPLDLFQWDASSGAFILNVDSAMLQNAPFFEEGQFPDTTLEGWNAEFDAFWQIGGGGTEGGNSNDNGNGNDNDNDNGNDNDNDNNNDNGG
jgi:hypothetical protein